MGKLKLNAKELRRLGYPDGPIISQAIRIMQQQHKHMPHDQLRHGWRGGLGEAPQAYKDIDGVMQAQCELIDVVGTSGRRVNATSRSIERLVAFKKL